VLFALFKLFFISHHFFLQLKEHRGEERPESLSQNHRMVGLGRDLWRSSNFMTAEFYFLEGREEDTSCMW